MDEGVLPALRTGADVTAGVGWAEEVCVDHHFLDGRAQAAEVAVIVLPVGDHRQLVAAACLAARVASRPNSIHAGRTGHKFMP